MCRPSAQGRAGGAWDACSKRERPFYTNATFTYILQSLGFNVGESYVFAHHSYSHHLAWAAFYDSAHFTAGENGGSEGGHGRWRPRGRRGRRRVLPLAPVRALGAVAPAGPGQTLSLRNGLWLWCQRCGLSSVTCPALPLLETTKVVRGGGFRPRRGGLYGHGEGGAR